MDLHLNDKTALVTGSTAGIGLEIALKLAVEGAKVTITGRSKTKLDHAVDRIRASSGARVSGVLADASTEEGAAALVRATPSVDILVNNLKGARGLGSNSQFSRSTAVHHCVFNINAICANRSRPS